MRTSGSPRRTEPQTERLSAKCAFVTESNHENPVRGREASCRGVWGKSDAPCDNPRALAGKRSACGSERFASYNPFLKTVWPVRCLIRRTKPFRPLQAGASRAPPPVIPLRRGVVSRQLRPRKYGEYLHWPRFHGFHGIGCACDKVQSLPDTPTVTVTAEAPLSEDAQKILGRVYSQSDTPVEVMGWGLLGFMSPAMSATAPGWVAASADVIDLAQSVPDLVEGAFSIIDWTGYPEGVPKT